MILLHPLFWIWRMLISPAVSLMFGVHCRYEESCSRFMERSIKERGLVRGFMVGFRRFVSCNKWSDKISEKIIETRRSHG